MLRQRSPQLQTLNDSVFVNVIKNSTPDITANNTNNGEYAGYDKGVFVCCLKVEISES
jgi:hypothetical protein